MYFICEAVEESCKGVDCQLAKGHSHTNMIRTAWGEEDHSFSTCLVKNKEVACIRWTKVFDEVIK